MSEERALPPSQPGNDGSTVLFRGGQVVDHPGADALLVEGERIAAIGSGEALAPRASTVIDLNGDWLSPGFVDTHVHMTGNGSHTAPTDMARDSREVLLLQAAENARRALAEGITTMRDCGARNDVIFPFRDAARAGTVTAPNILACGGALTRTGGHGHWWDLEADSDDEVRKRVREQSKAGADSLKVMVDGGIDLGRHAPGLLYFDPDALRVVVREANDWGLRVAAHCLTADGVRAAVAAGVTSVEHAIFYERDDDATRYDPQVAAEMADRGIYASPGPAFAYDVLTDPAAVTTFPRNARLFDQHLADDARLYEQGVALVASTDAGWYATPFGEFARVAELFVGRAGLSPRAAFDACTSVSAQSLGLGSRTGSIREGMDADLVVLGADPTRDVSAMRSVRLTMVRGQVRYRAA